MLSVLFSATSALEALATQLSPECPLDSGKSARWMIYFVKVVKRLVGVMAWLEAVLFLCIR